MKLHVVRASHNCRRVLATAEHLGLNLEIVEPQITSGELKTSAFLAINPNGKVPTLEDGDFKLWESNAIMTYLCRKAPKQTLLPSDPQAQADVVRWQFWDANHLSRGTTGMAFEKVFKPFLLKQDPNPQAVAEAEKTFHQFAPVLNAALEGRTFLVGEELSLADFAVAASFTYAEPGQFPWNDYGHIKAWYARLGEIPAWKNSAPKLG